MWQYVYCVALRLPCYRAPRVGLHYAPLTTPTAPCRCPGSVYEFIMEHERTKIMQEVGALVGCDCSCRCQYDLVSTHGIDSSWLISN